MDTLKIILFYGGDAATEPREQLLNWLRTPQVEAIIGKKIEAKKVADWPPNSGATVHDRVNEAIDWADKALLLFTPDPRCGHGAPNVLEEFGRWLGRKGGQSMAVIRHVDVLPSSNMAGLIYIGYKDNIIDECREKLLAFLQQPIMGLDNRKVDTLRPEEVELLQWAKDNNGTLQIHNTRNTFPFIYINGDSFRSETLIKLCLKGYIKRESQDLYELTDTGWKMATGLLNRLI